MVQTIAPQAFNVIDLESEIEAQVRNSPPIRDVRPVNVAPPTVSAPTPSIPDYVEHCEGATEIGKPVPPRWRARGRRGGDSAAVRHPAWSHSAK